METLAWIIVFLKLYGGMFVGAAALGLVAFAMGGLEFLAVYLVALLVFVVYVLDREE